jgi:hypothetical protein
LFYIKDRQNDQEEALKFNEKVKRLYQKLKGDVSVGGLGRLIYYERKKNNECRLALSKSLMDFAGKNPDLIVQWLWDSVKVFKTQSY